MEGIHSPIIIRNLKNKTTKVMYLDLHKIFKKIVIKQKPLILSNNSFKNISKTSCYFRIYRFLKKHLYVIPRGTHIGQKIPVNAFILAENIKFNTKK